MQVRHRHRVIQFQPVAEGLPSRFMPSDFASLVKPGVDFSQIESLPYDPDAPWNAPQGPMSDFQLALYSTQNCEQPTGPISLLD